MHHKQYAVYAIFSLLLLSTRPMSLGQDVSESALPSDPPMMAVEETDPRIAKLREQYRKQVDELSARLIADIEKLGAIGPPSHLQGVRKIGSIWAFHGSLSAFPNYSIGINARDIEATESWNHFLDNPPLGSRQALAIAEDAMKSWFTNEETKLSLQRLSLVPLSPLDGKWYWEAEYQVSQGRSKRKLTVAIRMDGKVLTQVESEKSRPPITH